MNRAIWRLMAVVMAISCCGSATETNETDAIAAILNKYGVTADLCFKHDIKARFFLVDYGPREITNDKAAIAPLLDREYKLFQAWATGRQNETQK